MNTTGQRRVWPLDRWREFAVRCQATYARIESFAGVIAGYPWSRAPHIDAFLKARNRMWYAMGTAQTVLAMQHGEFTDGRVDAVIFIQRNVTAGGQLHDHLRFDRKALKLTRAEWVELGREVKAIEQEIRDLRAPFQETKYATKPRVMHFIKVGEAISMAKCKLDSVCSDQHLDWKEFMHVFYGPESPRLIASLVEHAAPASIQGRI